LLWSTAVVVDALRPSLDVVAEEFRQSPSSVSASQEAEYESESQTSELELRAAAGANSSSALRTFQGWRVFYLVQASTWKSNDGEDGGIMQERGLYEIKETFSSVFSRSDGGVWDELKFTKTILVAPTKGAIGSALAFYANFLSKIVGILGPGSAKTLGISFEVIPELRPFQRWPNIGVTKTVKGTTALKYERWSSDAGDYHGRVTESGGFTLAPNIESLELHLRKLLVTLTAPGYLPRKHDDGDLTDIREELWTAVSSMLDSLRRLLPPDDSDSAWVDPLRPPESAKEVFTRLHKIKSRIYQLQYVPRDKYIPPWKIGRILMVGDPILATWMFPTAVLYPTHVSDFYYQSTELSATSLNWQKLRIPAPSVMIEAQWTLLEHDPDLYWKKTVVDFARMKPVFEDVEGITFAGSVPYFWSMDVHGKQYRLGTSFPVMLQSPSSLTTICLDDSDYVIPEVSQIDTGLEDVMPDTEARWRNLMPGSTQFHSYVMMVQRIDGMHRFTSGTKYLVYIVFHDELKPSSLHDVGKEAYISWLDLFGAATPQNSVDLSGDSATCELKTVVTGSGDSERTAYHIEMVDGSKKWKLTPVFKTETENRELTASFMNQYEEAKKFVE